MQSHLPFLAQFHSKYDSHSLSQNDLNFRGRQSFNYFSFCMKASTHPVRSSPKSSPFFWSNHTHSSTCRHLPSIFFSLYTTWFEVNPLTYIVWPIPLFSAIPAEPSLCPGRTYWLVPLPQPHPLASSFALATPIKWPFYPCYTLRTGPLLWLLLRLQTGGHVLSTVFSLRLLTVEKCLFDHIY